jgi:alkaline phosphatase
VRETLDFDQAVGVVLRWMQGRNDTLLLVTADHQTGGLSILGGDKAKGEVEGNFSSFWHSGVAVPVYAAGCGAALFAGMQDNTELAPKIRRAAGLQP